jgi:tetratricopeptide (TPR) repeat protein
VANAATGQSVARRKYIPLAWNKKFTGRERELEALEQKLFVEQDCQKIAVVGLGGIGKTQVALRFAYSVFKKHPDVSIFWVSALSTEAFEQAFREIARVLGFQVAVDKEEDAKEMVRRYLGTTKAGKWLLVVDNIDDMGIVRESGQEKGILQYLPESESGLTVFTTRNLNIAQSLVRSDVIELSKMTEIEAVGVLRGCLIRKNLVETEKATTDQLLIELDYLPLAITQAAAYVNCNKHISLSKYLDLLQSTEEDIIRILSTEISDPTRYEKASSAVAKTWLVSFEQLLRQEPDAANLLRYVSCIEWKAIPQSILPSVQPAERMSRAIGMLCSYSFVTPRTDEETYDMHRLVHVAVRVWVREDASMEETQWKALRHLCNVFPSDDYKNRAVWRSYIPHAARMEDTIPGNHAEVRGVLCLKVGRCLQVDGRIRDAVRWLEKSRDLRERLAEDHPSRLASQHELAIAYQANGQVKEAVRLLEQVVAIQEQVLAEDHPSRLVSQSVLASAYQANGQVKEAMELLEQVVAIYKRVLAEDHPSRLASQHNLASAYQANGQVKEAVRLLEQVVAIQEQVLAEDHPSRLASQSMLASAYQANGQAKEAVQLLEQVVAIYKRVLAEDHPDRLASQHNLASAYQVSGQVKEAVQLLEQVFKVEECSLAGDHLSRLATQHNLASAYQANGQVKEAVRLLEQVVAIQERVLAEDHPDQLASQSMLASAYQANGQVKEAVRLLEQVVKVEECSLAEDHPSRRVRQFLSALYMEDGQVEHAERLLRLLEVD